MLYFLLCSWFYPLHGELVLKFHCCVVLQKAIMDTVCQKSQSLDLWAHALIGKPSVIETGLISSLD